MRHTDSAGGLSIAELRGRVRWKITEYLLVLRDAGGGPIRPTNEQNVDTTSGPHPSLGTTPLSDEGNGPLLSSFPTGYARSPYPD